MSGCGWSGKRRIEGVGFKGLGVGLQGYRYGGVGDWGGMMVEGS